MPRIQEDGLKLCPRCKEYKTADAFSVLHSSLDGLSCWCKACYNAYSRERYQTNETYREELNRNRRERRASDPEYLERTRAALRKAYAKARLDPEKVEKERARQRAATREYPECGKAKTQKRQARKEANPKYRAQQNKQHRDRMRERYANDPGFKRHLRDYFARRRAVRRASGGTYDLEDWREMCALAKDRCVACDEKAEPTVDHVLPVIMGGSNYLVNLQPLCASCNSSKGAQLIDYRPPAMLQWLDLATD